MRKLLSTLAIAALLAGYSASANAEGWYGRADIGVTIDGKADVPFNDYDYYDSESVESARYVSEWSFFNSAEADLEDGWLVDAGLGYAFANGFRAEAELARRDDEVDVGSQYYYLSSSDNVIASSLMLNGFYDFNRGGSIQPYVGIGAGYAKVAIGEADDGNWAWQALAGVAIPLSERMSVDVGYRYFNVDDLDYPGVSDADYRHEAATIGLRYQFAAAAAPAPAPLPAPMPEPAPIPAPAACPMSQFVVYFEWDRSNLNQEAAATIDQAAARARECNVSAVAIVGHTDASGSNDYNMSERRSAVVRDALVERGLEAALMSMQARGESEMAKPTRDGVREPLNRRTAVTISFR
ncbi:MAG: outer membrane beta-barrel protein [Terricaulis sp.]